MAVLTNKSIASTYTSLLSIGASTTSSLSGSIQALTDGTGQLSPLAMSTTQIQFNTGSNTFKFPTTRGTSGQILKLADANGTLGWVADSVASTLNFSGGGSTTGSIALNTETLAFTGTANEIVTSASNQAITLSFPNAGVTLPNGSIATTQSASNNSTKVATTAYVEAAVAAGGDVTKTGTIALNTIAVWNDNADQLRSDTSMSINTNHTISLLQKNSANNNVGSFNIGGGNIANVTGQNNTGFGIANMQRVTTGTNNVAFGGGVLDKLTIGSSNVGVGKSSLFSCTEGDANTGVGHGSLADVTTGDDNTALGEGTGIDITTTSGNTFIGKDSGRQATGSNNTYVGFNSGSSLVGGDNNVIIGSNTGSTISTTSNNIIISDGSGNNRLQFSSTGLATFTPTGGNGTGAVNAIHLKNTGTSANDGTSILFTAGTSADGAAIKSTGQAFNSSDLRFFTGGSAAANERLTISSGGNVGIGTNGATNVIFSKLGVSNALSAIDISANYNPQIIGIQNTDTTANNYSLIGFQDALANINLASIGALNEVHSSSPNNVVGSLVFRTKPSGSAYTQERLRITSGGDVTLKGNGATSALIFDQTSYARIINKVDQTLYVDSDVHEFRTSGGVGKLTISSGGNVGINVTPSSTRTLLVKGQGTTSSTAAFQVNDGNNSDILVITDDKNATLNGYLKLGTSASQTILGDFGETNTYLINYNSGGTLKFLVGGGSSSNEKLTISSTGLIKVNGATSTSQFNILSSIANSILELKSTSTNPSGIYVKYTQAMNADSNFFFRGDGSTGVRVIIQSNGDLENQFSSYGGISDIKLKENIIDATPKLNDLLKVKIRNYNLIKNDRKQIGVIAQELEEIFPSMVSESPDIENREITDEEGNVTTEKVDLGTTTKSVKYSVFTPMLIKAIQEQQTIIEDLKARIETLEG